MLNPQFNETGIEVYIKDVEIQILASMELIYNLWC